MLVKGPCPGWPAGDSQVTEESNGKAEGWTFLLELWFSAGSFVPLGTLATSRDSCECNS